VNVGERERRAAVRKVWMRWPSRRRQTSSSSARYCCVSLVWCWWDCLWSMRRAAPLCALACGWTY